MNIGIVTDTYRPRVNGVVTSVDTFAREYEKMGHKVTIFAPAFPGAPEEPNVVRFPSMYLFFDPEDRLPNPWSPKTWKIEKTLAQYNLDILHTQTPFTLGYRAFRWAKKLGIPVVHTYHTLFTAYIHLYIKFIPKSWAVKLAIWISKNYCNQCDLIITPSGPMKDAVLTYGVTTPVEINPTGIKIGKFAKFDAAAFRTKFGVKPDEKMLLFMGRVAHEKNIDFLFRVLKNLLPEFPNTRLVVAGEGPAKAGLIELHKKMGLEGKVLFLGYFTAEDWVNCYAAADLFTFASITETQGLVVTEAMAVGTPVVAVGAMGVLDVMKGDRGGTTVKLDEAEFTATVRKYLTDKELHARKKKEAFEFAKEWSDHAMAVKMIGNFETTIAGYKAKKKT